MTHPEPPKGCPFFRKTDDGDWEYSPSAFQDDGSDWFILSRVCKPFRRYAAACVAIGWMLGQSSLPMTTYEYRLFWSLFAQWEEYLNAALAEMEASNG